MARQVKCIVKWEKLLYDSGDDKFADWGCINASDPIGLAGEYLGNSHLCLRSRSQSFRFTCVLMESEISFGREGKNFMPVMLSISLIVLT